MTACAKKCSFFSLALYIALAAGFGKPVETGLGSLLKPINESADRYLPTAMRSPGFITASRIDTQPVLTDQAVKQSKLPTPSSGGGVPNRSAADFGYRPNNGGRTVYTFVETPPQFPGGLQALFKYLSDHIKYPENSRAGGSEGTVFVNFTVDRMGALSDFKVKKGVMTKAVMDTVTIAGQTEKKIIEVRKAERDMDIDAEAIRVLKAMPNWLPGKQYGVPVDVSFTIPIKFKLE